VGKKGEATTMSNPNRISPLTVFFGGLFLLGGVAVAALTIVILQGMRMVESHTTTAMSLVRSGVERLPELINSLPPAINSVLGDRHVEYGDRVEVSVGLAPDDRGGVRPALIITNKGDEVVTLLAVRATALDSRGLPLREWTEVAATPIAIDHDWRGPILPRATRYLVMDEGRALPADKALNVTTVSEIADIRTAAKQAQAE
jgi:hypothetical protein